MEFSTGSLGLLDGYANRLVLNGLASDENES